VVEGDGSFVAHTIIHGRSGEIAVGDKVFNAVMPPIGTQQGLSDAEIAAVATYVRNAWGNKAEAVTADTVKQQR
jgi:mono/diheme cytochrome c family protein